jgi:2-polyprenyl-3-methyl-5-hydroxy-6-metoxy-1,4-benzoquinol methylase
MKSEILIRLFGWKTTLINSDTLVLDRWNWVSRNLPKNNNNDRLLDIGCGSGAFTNGASAKGYQALGLSWDKNNQQKAQKRALISNLTSTFEVLDVRELHIRSDLFCKFKYVICTENIEHIINDIKLLKDINNCLENNGTLLLTTPYKNFKPIWGDEKILKNPPIEDGGHVRFGYDENDCEKIFSETGFKIQKIDYCSGFLSQKISGLYRFVSGYNLFIAWLFILPLRVFPILFDKYIPYTNYSICVIAKKSA